MNNWLVHYSKQFSYFVVADSDSILPENFIRQMIHYAEHPSNRRVGIFESSIEAWNTKNTFAFLQTVMSPLHHAIKLRLDNRFLSTLSSGHNNLYRTSAVCDIGGFDEKFIAEDYAISMEMISPKK